MEDDWYVRAARAAQYGSQYGSQYDSQYNSQYGDRRELSPDHLELSPDPPSQDPLEKPKAWDHVRFGHDTSHAQAGAMRAGMTYDPGESLVSTLFRWRGTLLPMVLQKPMFWSLIGVNLCLLLYHDYSLAKGGDGLPGLSWDAALVRMAARGPAMPLPSPGLPHPCPSKCRCSHCTGPNVASNLLHCLLWATVLCPLLPVLRGLHSDEHVANGVDVDAQTPFWG